MAHIFYNEYLVTVINRPVIDIIEAKRKEGIRLILVSATLDVIAKEVSEDWIYQMCSLLIYPMINRMFVWVG